MIDREDELNAASDRLLNPKGLLYHYTSQHGLLGIIGKGQIWASHIRYLNDTNEYYAGRTFLSQIVHLMKEQKQADESTAKIVENTLRILDGFDIYVTSFSKADNGDSLNLWRAYAHTLPGYSIGFRAELVNRFLRSPHNQKANAIPQLTGLFGLEYIPKLEEGYIVKRDLAWIAQLMRTIVLRLKETDFDPAKLKGLSVQDMASAIKQSLDDFGKLALPLAFLLPLLKHEGFSGEQEHRIVCVRAPDEDFEHWTDIEFHPGCSSIVPHLLIDLPPDDLGIQRIVVGPCPDPGWAVRAVESLLKTRKIKVRRQGEATGVEVVSSKIPYRNW